ncbi:hypothetical protein BpHYR1_048348 [Brachionus plicatilis]|uniref:Uncharacterized protein n=1 Tax=Brachionus plicatilis TaxID=10195 RepID=A0A3M7QP17_BRAPC|nr:hypothetical protein BpHYR1_048348 [Brachionus plicatilis]
MNDCESWTLREKNQEKNQQFRHQLLQNNAQIKRLDKVLNAEIYKKIGIDPLGFQIKRRQFRYVGHSLCKRNEISKETGRNGAKFLTPANPKYLQSTDDDDDELP